MCDPADFYIVHDKAEPQPDQIIFSEIFFDNWNDQLQKTKFTYEQVSTDVKTITYVISNGYFHQIDFNEQAYWHNIFIDWVLADINIARLIAKSSYINKTEQLNKVIEYVGL